MKIREAITRHEAAILAHLDGRAGAPKLICTNPKLGIIVMQCINGRTISWHLGSNELSDETWLELLE